MLNVENLLELIITEIQINGVYNYFFIETLLNMKQAMKNHFE
jgi:hypothetical protein